MRWVDVSTVCRDNHLYIISPSYRAAFIWWLANPGHMEARILCLLAGQQSPELHGIRWCLCIDFISAKLCHCLILLALLPQNVNRRYTLVRFLPWYVYLGVCPPRNLRPGSWFQDKSEEAGSQVGFWNWTTSWPTGHEDPIIGYQCRELQEIKACWSAIVQGEFWILNRPWA